MTTVLSAAMLSLVTKQPVKIVLTKAEQLMAYEVRLGSTITAKVGMDKEGYGKGLWKATGWWTREPLRTPYRARWGVGLGEAQLVCAKCPNWYMDSHIAVTNKQAAGIVRGYGGQELNSCLER